MKGSDWEEIFANGPFSAFSMILKFSIGHFWTFYTDFEGPFFKWMGLWRMAPCLPNHWKGSMAGQSTSDQKTWPWRFNDSITKHTRLDSFPTGIDKDKIQQFPNGTTKGKPPQFCMESRQSELCIVALWCLYTMMWAYLHGLCYGFRQESFEANFFL